MAVADQPGAERFLRVAGMEGVGAEIAAEQRGLEAVRAPRQAVVTMRAASSLWSAPAGASSARAAAWKARYSAASSSASSTCRRARRPCLRALREERARPAALCGPRDLAPLRRLASARAPGCAPTSGELSLVMGCSSGAGELTFSPDSRMSRMSGDVLARFC
jgi:hypothetical protein